MFSSHVYICFCGLPYGGTVLLRLLDDVVQEPGSSNCNTWSYNKVRELTTVSLPCQLWTRALVWFDNVDILAFHSCVVVDLWQSLSELHLLLPVCVLVCHLENVGA